MLETVFSETEVKMKKTVEHFQSELGSMRAGRATPALLEKITVDYYGQPTPVNQTATISVPEPRLLVIQPWDKSQIEAIEKAILKSDLGINPTNDGNVIRLAVPQLTEERRQQLVKNLRRLAEEEKVAIRNIRRDGNDLLKDLEKEGEISEDDLRRNLEEIQEMTNTYIKEIDQLLSQKEEEILEV